MKILKLLSALVAATLWLAFASLSASAQTVPSGPVLLKVQHSGQCLDDYGWSRDDVTPIVQWGCHGGANQQWRFDPVPGGYHIVNVFSGKCLDVYGGLPDAGTKLIQYWCHGGANQTWRVSNSGGGWQLSVAHSNQCLDVYGGLQNYGTQVIQWPCHGGTNQQWKATNPDGSPIGGTAGGTSQLSTQGQWSARVNFPLVPVSASMLGNGKVMLWSGSGRTSFGGGNQTYSVLYDPDTGTMTSTLVTSPALEYFCEGTAQLPDGRVLVTGGSNPATSSLMDTAGRFSNGPNVNISRGYAGQTLTSRGQVFVLGGSWSGGSGGKKGELYTPGGSWSVLANVSPDDFVTADPSGVYRADNHMWLLAADDGWVFHAGPAKKMHWINTSGGGTVSTAGQRGNADAMNGNAVLYDVGKILTLGGAPTYDNATPSNAAFTVDITGGAGRAPSVAQTGSMQYPRTFLNSVVLPTGQVVAIGGQSAAGATPFSDASSALAAEIWDPATGRFTTGASMTTPRNYHSVAMLLMDGRVLSAGGGLCNCASDHPDGEIYSPPYLFNKDGSAAQRPVISSAPASAARGDRISVTAANAASFALVRMSSVTHSLNNDQRRIPLQVVSKNGDTATLQIPAATGTAIPGNYMLFALSATGTPSIAKAVNIR